MSTQVFIPINKRIVNISHVLFLNIEAGVCTLTLTNGTVLKTDNEKEINLVRKYLVVVSV